MLQYLNNNDERAKGNGRALLWAGLGAGLAVASAAVVLRRWEPDLNGHVALITGSSRGLGFLLAREFAARGPRLVICARDEQELQRARDDLDARGAAVLALPCDTTDQAQVEHLIHEARKRFGAIDILVNNAGTIQVRPYPHHDCGGFRSRAQADVLGAALRDNGGTAGHDPARQRPHCQHHVDWRKGQCAAPGALQLRQVCGCRTIGRAAATTKQHGIRVVTIVPGLMRTGSFLNAYFKGQLESEFRWFSLGATLPFISMDAERAAKQIARATARGEGERILSLPAKVLALFHGLFPGATAEMFGWVNRWVLPDGNGKQEARGMDVNEQARSKAWGLHQPRHFSGRALQSVSGSGSGITALLLVIQSARRRVPTI